MTDATSRIPKPQGRGIRNGAEAIGVSHVKERCYSDMVGKTAVASISTFARSSSSAATCTSVIAG